MTTEIDHPLEKLSWRGFEQLTTALAIKVIGDGVNAFGTGPDGGREATYEGPINWSRTTDSSTQNGSWNGYVVLQAKQRARDSSNRAENATWLKGQINEELDRWEALVSKRGRFPEYLIFSTNVTLSSVATVGGIDALHADIRKRWEASLRKKGLRDWKIWHRDQINALLTAYPEIRQSFDGMLTAGDVFDALSRMRGNPGVADLGPALKAHATSALVTERMIHFSEAGGNSQIPVSEVVVDLPTLDADTNLRSTVLQRVFSHGDQVLRPSIWKEGGPRNLVLTGMPGNGKTTLSRFIAEVYRASFLSETELTGKSAEVAHDTTSALERIGSKRPVHARWPLRVDLTEMADEIGVGGSSKTVTRWLAEKMSRRANIDIPAASLRSWLTAWPWMLIFDGLDEVTSPEVRRNVILEIEGFVAEAESADADLFVLITTRPTGYSERIDPSTFAQCDMSYMSIAQARTYGELVTSRRLASDADHRDQIIKRFNSEAQKESNQRLLTTPLQVLIMTFILESLGSLPTDRYQLFWKYYETVYNREAAKNTTLASLFSSHRADILNLHERVGLILQCQSEAAGDARALMPIGEFETLARERLIERGHDDQQEIDRVTAQLIQAATQRLVLLVPGEGSALHFEVRSLQELMAARALIDDQDLIVETRLKLCAPSPHWRNAWIFAAGKLFADGPDHHRDLILNVVETIDRRPDWPGWLCPVGPELAADILDDGLADTAPKWKLRLLNVVLRLLDGHVPRDARSVGRSLCSASNAKQQLHVRSKLKEAMKGAPKSRAAACIIASAGRIDLPPNFVPPEAAMYTKMWTGTTQRLTKVHTTEAHLRKGLQEIQDEASDVLPAVTAALEELKGLTVGELKDFGIWPRLPDQDMTWEATADALLDPETADVMDLLCGNVEPDHWVVTALIARAVWPTLTRVELGSQLEISMPTSS